MQTAKNEITVVDSKLAEALSTIRWALAQIALRNGVAAGPTAVHGQDGQQAGIAIWIAQGQAGSEPIWPGGGEEPVGRDRDEETARGA